MFDTMTMTKVIGAVCGSLLVFLLGAWAAEAIYHVGAEGHGEEHAQAYSIDTGEEEGGEDTAEADAGPSFDEVFQTASADDGESLFRACQACHKLDGTDGVGPHLDGVVGRDVASIDGFNYSGALVEVADVWSPENLNGFLENPREWAPGTAMSYRGMDDVEDRANLIAFLQSTGS
ncbi:c-type cytochrome [Anianabacter salinae]|uniref:c-type cytochrome n=1 Tax=Anianabacter salinae TaxID=2851023 RepID=UPI00225E1F93|nr:c-type cytochrome [Anianabacter salinae]MBV0913215.1 c-type cytochrome [Anianabacter salinae]